MSEPIKVLGLVTIFIRPTKKNSIAILSKVKGGSITVKSIQSVKDFHKYIEKRKTKIIPSMPFYFQIVKQAQDENGKWITTHNRNEITSQMNIELLDLIRQDCVQYYPATELAYILRIIDTNETELFELVNEENIKKVKEYLDFPVKPWYSSYGWLLI